MNKDFQNQIDNALNGDGNLEQSPENLSDGINNKLNSGVDKITGTLKENISHKPKTSSNISVDKNISENMTKSANKRELSSNLNRAKEKVKQKALQSARLAKEALKQKIKQRFVYKIIAAILAAIAPYLFIIILITVIASILFVAISAWFTFNADNFSGAFYNYRVVNTIKYNPKTNKVVASKLNPDNVLAGVFYEYYAKNAYYYTVTPYVDENGNVKTNLDDPYSLELKQHTEEDTIKDKFGMETKFTLSSIMLMNLNKSINNNLKTNLYYPQSFIKPIFNSCSVADNDTLYTSYTTKYKDYTDGTINSDLSSVEVRKNLKNKSVSEIKEAIISAKSSDVGNSTYDSMFCKRLNLSIDKEEVVLSTKYKITYLDASYKEISLDEYKKQKEEGKTAYKIYRPSDGEYQVGSWSWGLSPIFNYEEYQERDEIRNIKVSTVPVWNREEQKMESISYEGGLTDDQKEYYKNKIKTNWSDITQNEQYVYLINNVQTYMGSAQNKTELVEQFAMSNYSNFKNSTDEITIDIEKRISSKDDITKLNNFTDVIVGEGKGAKTYLNVKDIFYGYKTADEKECEEEVEKCIRNKEDEDCKSYKFADVSSKPDDYTEEYIEQAKYKSQNIKTCHTIKKHIQGIYIKTEDGREVKIGDDASAFDTTVKAYYLSTAKGMVRYAGDLFEFRANYTDDFAKVSNVNFDYITQYINSYTLFVPLEKQENVSGNNNIYNVKISIEDYAKFYAKDSDGNELVDEKATNAENEKTINDYIKKEKEKGHDEMSIQMIDPNFEGTDCSKYPERCVTTEELSQYNWFNNAEIVDFSCPSGMTYRPSNMSCSDSSSGKISNYYVNIHSAKVPVKSTINNTEISVSNRAKSLSLRISDLLGIKIGSDYELNDNSTFGTDVYAGTFIQGDLCIHEGTKGKNKTYMDYKKITSTSSAQYKYIHSHMADGTLKVTNEGLLLTNDGFIGVALGSHYGKIGDKFVFTLSTGVQLKVVKLDEKSDAHTDPMGCYHVADKTYSTLEFVIDTETAKTAFGVKGNGYVAGGNFNNIEKFSGQIVAVQVGSESISNSTNNNFNASQNSSSTINSSTGIAIGGKSQDAKVVKIKNSSNYDLIKKYASRYGVDSELMVVVAAYASGGEHSGENCKKSSTKCGYMGLSTYSFDKTTFNNVLDTEEIKEYNFEVSSDELKDLETNIKFGSIAMAYYLKKYEYNPLMAIYAYFEGESSMNSALNEYIKKSGNPDRTKVCQDYSDISWTTSANASNAISILSDVLQYFNGTSMHFKKIEGTEIKDVGVTVSSLNTTTIQESSSADNTLAAKLQAKIDTVMSGNIVEENWELLFPNVDKDSNDIKYDELTGEVVKGIKDYRRYAVSEMNQTDIKNIIKTAYLVGTNGDIESLDNLTELDWEQKFLESFGKKSNNGRIATDTTKYFQGSYVGIASTGLSLYQHYGTVEDVDSGKIFYHDYVGVKASNGTQLQIPSEGIVADFGYSKTLGKFVRVKHGTLSESLFYNLDSVASDLKKDMELKAGQVIGTCGEEPFKYSLSVNDRTVNPEWIILNNQYTAVISNLGGNYTVTGNSEIGNRIAQLALTKVGLPYVWGGAHDMSAIKNPSNTKFDCSGLVNWAYYQSGVNIGSQTTRTLINMGQAVSRDQLQAGDIVLTSTHHVVIYIGNNMVVHAPQTGDVVKVSKLWAFTAGRRLY